MDIKQVYLQLQHDAEDIVEKAVPILHSFENSFTTVNQKDEGDMATSADIASEKCIIEEIQRRYPTHGICSEEAGTIPGKEPYTWIIDPLDQTKEYSRHAGEYNCLIAIEHENTLVASITKRISTNELFSCSKGNGAFRNGKSIHVSTIDTLEKAFISCYLPNKKFPETEIIKDLAILNNLIHHCYRVRGNNDEAKAFAWVSKGVYDGQIFVPGGGKWHDIAPGILLVQEAGGIVTNWEGTQVKNRDVDHGIVASNGIVHAQLLELIEKSN